MPQGRYPCKNVVPIEEEPRHHLVLENEFIRAFAVEIAPHDRTLCHHHAHDYLMYVAGDAEIVSAPRDGEPQVHRYHDGACELSSAGMVHVVENRRDTPFRNVVVEFLPGAADLRRGRDPKLKLASGKSLAIAARSERLGKVRQRFDDPRAAIYRVTLEYAAEINLCGPAILASPDEGEVVLETPSIGLINLSRFSDLEWIAPGQSGVVRNAGKRVAQVVVFQLGHI